MNDSLYGFCWPGGRSSNAAQRDYFILVTLLRTIYQFTPFSVWRIERTGNSLLEKDESAISAGGESKWLPYQKYLNI